MKDIRIKSMRLLNFKGVRDYTFEPDGQSVRVSGRNGTGKTTLFDAFTWLLFGKDSKDRKVFNLRTFDTDGRIIERLPHEVSATLTVDGVEVKLTRCFKENWVKKRGTSEVAYDGNSEERYYDGVPMNVAQWNEKINAICDEQTFKFVTNPHYFASQTMDSRRALLFRMAGEVTDEQVAEGSDLFKALLERLSGKTMEEFHRAIVNEKKTLKETADAIPERIDERRRDMNDEHGRIDTGKVYALTAALDAENEALEREMRDEAEAYRKSVAERTASLKKLLEKCEQLRRQRMERESEVRREAEKAYCEAEDRKSALTAKARRERDRVNDAQSAANADAAEIERLNVKRETLKAEWKSIKAEEITFDDKDFICPTCKRPLEPDDVILRQDKMREAFNADKAERLARNVEKGQGVRKLIDEKTAHMEGMLKAAKEYGESADKAQAEADAILLPEKPDIEAVLKSDALITSLDAQIAEAEKVYEDAKNETETGAPDTSRITVRRQEIAKEKAELTAQLSLADTYRKSSERIAELEEQLRKTNDRITELEGLEFTMSEFTKKRVQMVENKINAMFTIVKFKMFDRLINGSEVEVCEAMINGTPLGDGLSAAESIAAGFDIISAIVRWRGVKAPVFIDNAEGVVMDIPNTEGVQMIRLEVSPECGLTVSRRSGAYEKGEE